MDIALRSLIVAAVTFLSASCLNAQAYSASQISNAFPAHDISATGTILPGGANLDDNLESVNFPAGFTFAFYGATYTSMTVCSNGWLYFGPTQTLTQAQNRDTPASAPLPALPNNYIAGCWDDLDPEDPLSGKVRMQRLSSPDRLVILWDKIGHFGIAATQKGHFLIVLFATTNVIEVHYGSEQSIVPGASGLGAGVENSAGTDATTRPGGILGTPGPTDAFRWDPPANMPPAITVERDIGTTPLELVNTLPTIVRTGTTLANLGLRFRVRDTNAAQSLTLTTVVAPSANIAGFTQSQWNAGPSTAQPVTALPTTGSFGIVGDIQVTLTASDGTDQTVFTFIIRVLLPALSGTVTINQTAAADFNSVGAAFDYLEANGILGPVVLTITDSATYVADASYSLGISANGQAATPVMGASATNTITLRPATGQTPVIQGNATGAVLYPQSVSPTLTLLTGRGALGMMQSFFTVEGLEITGGPHFGVIMQGNSSQGLNPTDMTVRRCRVHGIPNGPGIAYMGQNSARSTNVVIEHNFVWNCYNTGLAPSGAILGATLGSISVRNAADGSGVVRHNTVLHTTTVATTAGIYVGASSLPEFQLHECSNNIVVVTSPTLAALGIQQPTQVPKAANCNFNFWNAAIMSNQAAYATFPAWQLSGRDAQGSNADPKLNSIVGPNYDLHLHGTSPCIDPPGQTSTATIDVDGEARPRGPRTDIGADEAESPSDIELMMGATPVLNGATINLGNVALSGVQGVFTINNLGTGDLSLPGTPAVQIAPGANLDASTAVQAQPGSVLVMPSGSTGFTLFIDPTATVAFDLLVSIATNDPDEDPFTFTIQGSGFHNDPADATAPAGSMFSGPLNGPFEVSVMPGDVLIDAVVRLSDPDGNVVIVTSIVPPAGVPAWVMAPTNPSPGLPLDLTWTGGIAANATPGIFTWTITFRDSVDQTPVVITVTIVVGDLPPEHSAALGIVGNGSAATPYRTAFTAGMTSASSVGLARVRDANTGQAPSVAGVTDVSGLGGTGFQFSLTGGLLSAAPAGTLIAADAGTQLWEVTITDGTNPVLVTIEFQVAPAVVITTGATLSPIVRSAQFAGVTIATTGGTGFVARTLVGGALPAGLSMNVSGLVSGTTLAAAGPYSFTVRATDSLGVFVQQAFQVDVVEPAAGLPTITSGPALPGGEQNRGYGPVTLAAAGGVGPYVFSIESGALPAGLSLSTAGVISGTPTSIGSSTFTVHIQDSATPAAFNTAVLTLDVGAPPPPSADSTDGCAAALAPGGTGLLALLALAWMARRRRR